MSAQTLITDTPGYHAGWAERRRLSTMAEVGRSWLCERAVHWREESLRKADGSDFRLGSASSPAAFRVLSVGCGDGNLDLPLLEALAATGPVCYRGLDTNTVSLESFSRLLSARTQAQPALARTLHTALSADAAETFSPEGEPFDLIVFSHVLYYFAEPAALVSRFLQEHTRTGGRVVVIHSAYRGIPQVMDQALDLPPFLTAEDIAKGLRASGLAPDVETVDTTLDCTPILAGSALGEQVLGFCVERDLQTLQPRQRFALLKSLWTQCEFSDATGEASLTESLGFLTLSNDLRRLSPDRIMSGIDRAVDALKDYHLLAREFDWPERLHGVSSILDVGSGTGRWLRVLAHTWPELAPPVPGRTEPAASCPRYHAIDSRPDVEPALRESASRLFEVEQLWHQTIESIDTLPPAHYDLIWSMHSLYGVAPRDLEPALVRLLASLKDDGLAVLVLPDAGSFYIEACAQLTEAIRFTSADDVCRALESMGICFEIRKLDYSESFAHTDEAGLRHYLWCESIGNTFGPSPTTQELPPLPDNAWWLGHREGDHFVFRQRIRVITVRGGQRGQSRQRLIPDRDLLAVLARTAAEFSVREHQGLADSPVFRRRLEENAPSWVHSAATGPHQQAAYALFRETTHEPVPEWGQTDLRGALEQWVKPLAEYGTVDNAPGFMGYIPSGGLFLAAASEWIAASLNRYSAMFLAAPGLGSIEAQAIRWLAQALGLEAASRAAGLEPGGVLVSGASTATLLAVHAARHRHEQWGLTGEPGLLVDPGKRVAYCAETAHACIDQALSICAIPHRRKLPVDASHRLDLAGLQQAIETDLAAGLQPFFLAASAGEVGLGAIDDLQALRRLSDRYKLWLHVDGAYGGFFALTPEGARALQGMAESDSLCVDPHKGLGFPYGTGALLVRDRRALKAAFSIQGGYLPPEEHGPEWDPEPMQMGLEMTRPFRGLRVWLTLKVLGLAPFRSHLQHMMALARRLAAALTRLDEIEVLGDPVFPVLSVCAFRLRSPATDADNRWLLDEINRDGRFFLTGFTVPASRGGGFALRAAILSFRTQTETVDALANYIAAALCERRGYRQTWTGMPSNSV